jgi:hypothetical protein
MLYPFGTSPIATAKAPYSESYLIVNYDETESTRSVIGELTWNIIGTQERIYSTFRRIAMTTPYSYSSQTQSWEAVATAPLVNYLENSWTYRLRVGNVSHSVVSTKFVSNLQGFSRAKFARYTRRNAFSSSYYFCPVVHQNWDGSAHPWISVVKNSDH